MRTQPSSFPVHGIKTPYLEKVSEKWKESIGNNREHLSTAY
jgi:hypothetical protein